MSRWTRVRWALVPIGTAAALTVARLVYYGHVFPNTYYAKSVAQPAAARDGGRYLWHIFQRNVGGHWQIPGLTVLAAVGSAIALGAAFLPGPDGTWSPARRYASVLVAAQVVCVLVAGGTGGYRPRFVAVMVVPVVLLVTMGATAIAKRLPVPETAVGIGLIGVIAVASAAGLLRYRDTVAALGHGISDASLIGQGGLGLSSIWGGRTRDGRLRTARVDDRHEVRSA